MLKIQGKIFHKYFDVFQILLIFLQYKTFQ